MSAAIIVRPSVGPVGGVKDPRPTTGIAPETGFARENRRAASDDRPHREKVGWDDPRIDVYNDRGPRRKP